MNKTRYYIRGKEVTYEELLKYREERKKKAKLIPEDPRKTLAKLKEELASTDYKAIKYAEHLYSEEEYEPTRKEREELRSKIKELEAQIKKLDK